jgi:type IV secretion system protein VirD4
MFAGTVCSCRTACSSGAFAGSYLRHAGPEHVMAFAPTRSGKGVGLVVPTLLSWPGSAVIHDIKGENWTLTAGWRSKFSQCIRFDPTDSDSPRYNPLLEVRRGAREVADAQNIADILVDPEGSLERRSHWEKTGHALLVGVILHVLYAESDKTLAGCAKFLSDPDRTFAATLRVMMSTRHLGSAVHPVVAQSARELLNKSENERSGVLSTALSFLSLYRDPVVAEVTSASDWRVEDLVGSARPVSLYLACPPSDVSRTKPLMRLVLNQIARRLTESRSPIRRGENSCSCWTNSRCLGGSTSSRRAGVHGGLRHPGLPRRPVTEPDREGLWPEQCDPRQLPCAGGLCDQ